VLCRGLEHLKIETTQTRLIDERFESVMGESVIVTLKVKGTPSIFKEIRSTEENAVRR
jgi:hypothetical protein